MKPLRKILLVDDDPDILTITKYALQLNKNLEVMCALSGYEAIDVARSFKPDLILLDVMMPKMDGITTLSLMHQMPELKESKFVFFTAKISDSELASYNKYDVIGILFKPFDPLKIYETIINLWLNSPKK